MMMNPVFVFLLLAFIAFSTATGPDDQMDLKIRTTSGILHGKLDTVLNRSVRKFLGVQYGEPPVGDLRFKPPVEYEAVGTIKDATEYASGCMQPPHFRSVISPLLNVRDNFSEDCLYLNIYVPVDEEISTPLPVMVWLAGEGFDYADAQQFDGSYLAVLGNTIVVTLDYRLSAFGFASALTPEVPGNVGLLDQKLALQWIKKNINNFGGNPSLITLFGRFTGAMSAAIHAFSPLTKGEQLFSKIILQSGIPVGNWVFDSNPLNLTMSLAEKLECNVTDIDQTIQCLKETPADILLRNAVTLPERFRPIFDNELIIHTNTVNKSNFAPVDVIIGMNEDEGSICSIALKAVRSPLYSKIMSNNFDERDLKLLLKKNLRSFYKKDDPLAVKLTAYKYRTSPMKMSPRKALIKFCGDLYIKSHSFKLAEELIKNGLKVYMYRFLHKPTFSVFPSFLGSAHGEDVLFSMGLPMKMQNISEEEAKLTRQMVQSFSNFARKGDPNPVQNKKLWEQFPKIMDFPDVAGVTGEQLMREDAKFFFQELIPDIHNHCREK